MRKMPYREITTLLFIATLLVFVFAERYTQANAARRTSISISSKKTPDPAAMQEKKGIPAAIIAN